MKQYWENNFSWETIFWEQRSNKGFSWLVCSGFCLFVDFLFVCWSFQWSPPSMKSPCITYKSWFGGPVLWCSAFEMLKDDWSLTRNRKHVKITRLWNTNLYKFTNRRCVVTGPNLREIFWKIVTNPDILQVVNNIVIVGELRRDKPVAISPCTSIKCHSSLFVIMLFIFCYLAYLDFPGRTYISTAEQLQHSWILIPGVLLNWELQLSWRSSLDLLCLRNTTQHRKPFG